MIIHGDAVDFLGVAEYNIGAIFADIPDNIGLKYAGVSDNLDERIYRAWVKRLIERALSKTDIFWLSYNQMHDLWIKGMIYDLMVRATMWGYRQVIWRYTFGQYNDLDFSSGYRPIALFVKSGTQLNFDAIRIASERMNLGDKRASGPRVPDDVWDYPRIQGNNNERRSWHPTQHPEMLMTRIALLSCTRTENGSTRCVRKMTDLCLGSGTTAIVCQKLGIDWYGVELSKSYCDEVAKIVRSEVTTVKEFGKW